MARLRTWRLSGKCDSSVRDEMVDLLRMCMCRLIWKMESLSSRYDGSGGDVEAQLRM
jgi:hypothetical protein